MEKFEKQTNYKAFSLTEVLVALFVFVLVITTAIATFGNVVKVRKKTKNLQQNLENMKYGMELMAKSVRMSGKVDDGGSEQTIYMYNNSEGRCLSYRFINNSLERGESMVGYEDCGRDSNFTYTRIARGNIAGKFAVTPSSKSSPKRIGKVVISIIIDTGSGSSMDVVRSQTTVSLRNYEEVVI